MTLFPRGDEREVAVELAADRLAYVVLAFGILAVVIFRSALLHEASWDLLALVVVSGVVKLTYRVWHRAFGARLAIPVLAAVAVAAFVALVVILFRAGAFIR
jgi:hypothetical protein